MAFPSDHAPSPTPAVGSAQAEPSLAGRRIGKYEVVRLIGRGGMGTVYEARSTAIGKRVAMKFISAGAARDPEGAARFQREAEAASAVESAHIVEIFDSGTSDEGQPYIVMELLRGEDLGHRIKRCGRLDIAEAIHVVAQLLRGLHRAHEAGIVHRDLKPDNVFLVDRDDDMGHEGDTARRSPGFVKILDFGISKVRKTGTTPVDTLTSKGTVLGTPFYMAPEQAQALPDIDGRADLWSVGAILFECLTGRPPHSGATYEQVIVSICMNDADDVRLYNPVVPELLADVLAKALARDREARFASARDFLDALKATSTQLTVASVSGAGAESGAAALNSNDFRLTPRALPRSNEATPSTAIASDATLEVPTPAAMRGGARRREARTFVLVAGTAVLAAAVVTFQIVRGRRVDGGPAITAIAAQSGDVMVQLRASVPQARFFVGDAEVLGGALTGPVGAVRRVHVEADGYAAGEIEVTLAAGATVPVVVLSASPVTAAATPVTIASAPSAIASASPTSATTDAATAPSAKSRPVLKPPSATKAAGDGAVTAAAATTAAATSPPTGVAGQLKLKKD